MSDRKFEFTNPKGGSAIGVRVVTRCAATELAGKNEDGSIKVRLRASSAGEDAANDELVSFIASKLGVGSERLEVVAGAHEREKILSIEGMTAPEVDKKLFG
jgi:uncharacterized protein YggU (UPF0235/DUF167 family)